MRKVLFPLVLLVPLVVFAGATPAAADPPAPVPVPEPCGEIIGQTCVAFAGEQAESVQAAGAWAFETGFGTVEQSDSNIFQCIGKLFLEAPPTAGTQSAVGFALSLVSPQLQEVVSSNEYTARLAAGDCGGTVQNQCWAPRENHVAYPSASSGRGWSDASDWCDWTQLGEATIAIAADEPTTGGDPGYKAENSAGIYVKTSIAEPVAYTGSICYESSAHFDRPGAFPGMDGGFEEKCA